MYYDIELFWPFPTLKFPLGLYNARLPRATRGVIPTKIATRLKRRKFVTPPAATIHKGLPIEVQLARFRWTRRRGRRSEGVFYLK